MLARMNCNFLSGPYWDRTSDPHSLFPLQAQKLSQSLSLVNHPSVGFRLLGGPVGDFWWSPISSTFLFQKSFKSFQISIELTACSTSPRLKLRYINSLKNSLQLSQINYLHVVNAQVFQKLFAKLLKTYWLTSSKNCLKSYLTSSVGFTESDFVGQCWK